MHHLNAALRRRAAAQDGFTMIVAMTAMLAVMILSAAAFAAANGDIHVSSTNDRSKQAYAAAEAAIADYQYHLNQNPDYWRKCASTGDSSPVNQPFTGTNDETRKWRDLPGSQAQYTIEVLPAAGYTQCNTASPDKSMIDTSNGTFRIRATGRLTTDKTVKRSIVATFKRTGFLDFLWYTDFESQDPVVWSKVNGCAGTPTSDAGTNYPTCFVTGNATGTKPDLATWSASQCAKYWRDGRGSSSYPGQFKNVTSPWYSGSGLNNNQWYDLDDRACTEIVYGTGEYIKGPFHTNDGILVCDNPIFGRTTADRIEVSATANQNPSRASGGCDDNKQMQGTWLPGSPRLDPPPSNASLSKSAAYTFKGATRIVFNGDGTMTVTNNQLSPRTQTLAEQPDEVIFIQANATCTYDPYKPVVWDGTTTGTGKDCGDAIVQGQYTQNTTIGADNDIVITDDLTGASGKDALMGLIANNFVRVAHPSSFDPNGTAQWTDALYALMSTSTQRQLHMAPKCTNTSTATKDLKVEAAILALNHQWTVDRYGCGAGLGTLRVTGTIAQKHRGVVGIGNGTTGFIKNYTYDDRLRYRSPPKFLDPVNTAWNVAREIEQSRAT